MTNFTKKLSITLIICIFLISYLMPLTAHAASLEVKTRGSSTVTVGKEVTIDVSFMHKGIGTIKDGKFEYNTSVLEFISGNGANITGSGGKIVLVAESETEFSLETSLKFLAIGDGSSKVTVSGDIIDFISDKSVGKVNSSTTITVNPKPTPTPKPTEKPTEKPTPKPTSKPTAKPTKKPTSTPKATPTPEPTPTPVPTPTPTPEVIYNPLDDAIKLDIHGEDLYMWKDLSTVELPEGFGLGSITYDGEKVEAMMDSENKLILVYLTDENGENGELYYYDSTTGNVFSYANVETNLSYVILQPDKSVEIPQGYKETTYIISDKTVKAWVLESGEEIGFYLVYAMDSKGNRGFYTYDSSEGTLQRFTERIVTIEAKATEEPKVVDTITDDVKAEPEQGIFQRFSLLMTIVIIVLVILFIVLAALLIMDSKKRKTIKHGRRK